LALELEAASATYAKLTYGTTTTTTTACAACSVFISACVEYYIQQLRIR
jgi:hypothetical protein